MKRINRARLNRIESRIGFADDWPGPVIQVLVATHEEASQSRELDELVNTGQAYIDETLLPPKEEGKSFLFRDLMAAVVQISPDDIEREQAGERRERMFL